MNQHEPIFFTPPSGKQRNRRMYKGGGGGGSSTTTQEIPAELKPLATAYTSKAIDLGNQTYNPYQGQRYADLNTTQNAGLQMATNRALSGSPTFNNAESNLNQMMQGGTNPYLDAMVRKSQGSVMSNAATAMNRSGSFGNSGIQEQALSQMGDIANNMYGQQYQFDQGQRMNAIGMAPQFANQAYQDASQLLNAGQIQQDQAQRKLDVGYQNYQEAENLPYKQLAAMSGVFGSNLGAQSTTQSSGGGK